MISLEQIRLLESKITRALDLIRILKDENSTLRKGVESAQKRMKELETLVDGFKADQSEIETVIVRTLHTLDELEENAAAAKKQGVGPGSAPGGTTAAAGGVSAPPSASLSALPRVEASSARRPTVDEQPPVVENRREPADEQPRTAKEELDIF